MTESCILLMGDLHIGRKTNSYDTNEYLRRIEVCRHNLLKVKRIVNRSHKLRELNIFMLGDIVDGEEIYRGHGYNVEKDVDESVDIAVSSLYNFIKSLERNFRQIKVWCVRGNHGRTAGSERSNWDKIVYKRLEDRFADTNNVEVNMHKAKNDWYCMAYVKDWAYLLTHGDAIRAYSNIPVYGMIHKAMRWKSGGIFEDFDVMCIGHFHTVLMLQHNDIMLMCNGTMLSGDSYSERLGLQPVNKFIFFGADDDRPVTWIYMIDLIEKR